MTAMMSSTVGSSSRRRLNFSINGNGGSAGGILPWLKSAQTMM